MGNENDRRYGGTGRNLWRKVYGYQVNKPQVVAIVDTTTATTYSLDLNKTLRHRDYYKLGGVIGTNTSSTTPAIPVTWQYDEGLVSMNGGEVGTGSFNFAFASSSPIVVLTADSASLWGENLQVFGFSRNASSFTFGTSAPFSGTIRYRAIYDSAGYPSFVTSAYTSSITASAGSTVLTNQHMYTASFAALPGLPFRFLQTAWLESSTLGDVAFQTQTSSSSTATVEISAPVSVTVHYIAFY